MKKYLYTLPVVAMFALPLMASAHQHASFTIGGATYQFVVGSLNEPLVVDDKSGVDLTVTKGGGSATMSADGEMDGAAAASTPVSGLDQTLKVTLIGGGTKQTLPLTVQYGKPGAYQAVFYPTAATTLSYEFTGTIDGNPVDITFTCLPEGGTAANDMTSHALSDGNTQTMISGGFGCPLNKQSLGFPEQSATISSLSQLASSAKSSSTWGIGLGAIAVVLAGLALMRRK